MSEIFILCLPKHHMALKNERWWTERVSDSLLMGHEKNFGYFNRKNTIW